MKDKTSDHKFGWFQIKMPRRRLFKMSSVAGGMVAAGMVWGRAGNAGAQGKEGNAVPGDAEAGTSANGRAAFLKYEEARPSQMREMIGEAAVAYVPFGALEWHGEHGPLGLDGLKARALCEEAAGRTGGVVFPAVFWGAFDTVKFPFTFNFRKSGIQYLVRETLSQLDDWGFKVIIMLTGHYPPSMQNLLRRECRRHNKKGKAIAMGAPEQVFAVDIGYLGDHAGMWETSIMMAMRPELVDLSAMPKGLSTPDRYQKYGVMGLDPTEKASPELGRTAIAHITDNLAGVVNQTLKQGNDAAIEKLYADYDKATTIPAEIQAMDLHSTRDMFQYGLTWIGIKP